MPFWKEPNGYWKEGWAFATIVTGVVAAVCVIALAVAVVANRISKHYDKAACHSYSTNTGRQVRFVTYTFWSWDCLTPAADGKWIPTSNLRDLTGQP